MSALLRWECIEMSKGLKIAGVDPPVPSAVNVHPVLLITNYASLMIADVGRTGR